jgi:hypothetical protein
VFGRFRSALAAWALVGLLVSGCGIPAQTPAVTADPGASQPSSAATPTSLSISVSDAKYGALSLRTAPGATCNVSLQTPVGFYGDAPPRALPDQIATQDGTVTWTYPTPRIPSGTASYTARCQSPTSSETKNGAFFVPTRPMTAASLTVRVTMDAPPHETVSPDPSLVPLREASFTSIKAKLGDEWRSATRGLGSLQVVEDSADITMFVIAARGTSVHRTSLSDDSQDILIYVSGELGPRTVENNLAVALHEIGHIWCCRGPEANETGHWAAKRQSPGLYGVDKYGLMNEPVLCTQFGTILSCPNRFSDREMVALGFTTFPPPSPDPCIQQGLALRSQIGGARATLGALDAQIRAIEAQYPGGAPPAVYNTYLSLIAQYNALNEETNAKIRQLNGLPCDSSP